MEARRAGAVTESQGPAPPCRLQAAEEQVGGRTTAEVQYDGQVGPGVGRGLPSAMSSFRDVPTSHL